MISRKKILKRIEVFLKAARGQSKAPVCVRRTGRSERGFTLLELLIAIVILGILSAMIVPRFTEATNKAKCNVERSNIATINTQIELYSVNTGVWPEYPSMTSLISSNTYFPDGGPRDPFSNADIFGTYTLDMSGSPARMRVYTQNHLASTLAPHVSCATIF